MLSAGPVCSCEHFFVPLHTGPRVQRAPGLPCALVIPRDTSRRINSGRASPASVAVRPDAFSTFPCDGQGEGDELAALVAGQAGLSCTFGS
jgi:hypothetical protein